MVNIYRSLIEPVMTYAAPVLILASKTQFSRLQKLQNKALRLCTRAPSHISAAILRREVGVESIHDRILSLTRGFVDRLSFHDPHGLLSVQTRPPKRKSRPSLLQLHSQLPSLSTPLPPD